MASSEEQQGREASNEAVIHKTKTIQFFGRTTPIILQNDNGPCPLLAICNVLLLRNQLNLNSDITEVSQEKLLSIDDFEFTPECAIFDLLNIPLYHGWLVDPQDRETAEAIGSKSYNTLMGDLVSLEHEKWRRKARINVMKIALICGCNYCNFGCSFTLSVKG
ncbi:Ubiquitin carboxyl-terminal hydrolase MINDY-1 [Bienertia sinuspersici]